MNKDYLGGCIIHNDIGTWAPQVWDKLIEVFKPKKIIDVGCGAGHSTKYFFEKKIEVLGIEGYVPAIESSVIKEKIYVHDYVMSEFIPDQIYDIAWCCEFVEHVEEKYMENFMRTFDMCKVVAMTHALPGQPGYHHVNCQTHDYWIEKFKSRGFKYNEQLSIDCRNLLPSYEYDNNGNVTKIPNGGHVKNTLMIFEK